MTNQPAAEGERRLVTILFGDLVGYTSVSEARDPELIQESLNLCFGRLGAEIRRFGGYVDKVVGDEIMALFGAPRAQEDDAGKAVAAALAMQRALADMGDEIEARLGVRFRIRIGVNTGVVVTGAVGPGGYTVTGDAVNVAARLEKAAEPGEVLVGEATRRLARRPLAWGERRELTVKGRLEPVVAYTARTAGPDVSRLVPAPSRTPFVGRIEYGERLAALWAEAGQGSLRVLEVVGESGIGKTRFIANFFASAGLESEQVLYSRADTPPRTFGPLLQLLPLLEESLPPAFQQRLEVMAWAQDAELIPDVERDWMVDGLAALVENLAQAGRVALVLDDLHRADTATIAVIERLLPRLESLPVLVLLLRQPTGRRPRRAASTDSLRLEPLTADQSRSLALVTAPALAPAVVDAVVSRAGGNPLYLELLAAAASVNPESVDVPESLQTAVVARVDELDETASAVLRDASVFGQSFYEETLKLTTTVSQGLYEALARLCEVGLLDETPSETARRYQFRHSLVQDILYQGLLRGRRAELHRRAAEALELAQESGLPVSPEELAFHYERGGNPQRAAHYHLTAAERADRLRAPGEARNHRRAANRLLNLTSLAEMYSTQRKPGAGARAAGAGVQVAFSALLLLPLFLVFALHRPGPNVMTLGLPTEIVGFNLSSILLAVVIGGLPLLVAGIVFAHLLAPLLMRRKVPMAALAGAVLGGWALGLAFVLAGFGVLVGLLRLNLLDRISSMYVGGTTLQLLIGDRSLLVMVVTGTLVVAIAWTALLRLQAARWARLRGSVATPRQLEEGRRWAALRQVGMLVGGAALISIGVLAAYQFRWLPDAGRQPGLPSAAFAALLAAFGAAAIAGIGTTLATGRRLRRAGSRYPAPAFGFEAPLFCALAFGLVAWFGMRQAVVVTANDVDVAGHMSSFNTAVHLFPNLGLAYYLRGERHIADGDYAAAAPDLDRAIQLDPNFPAAYLARSRTRIALGDFEGARADSTKLVALRPDHPGGYATRAWAEYAAGDSAAAAQDYAVATQPLPPDLEGWDAYFIRCLAFAAMQKNDQAQADCQHVIDLNAREVVALDKLAGISFAKGDYQSVVDYGTRVLRIEPNSAVALRNRGTAFWYLQRYDEADRDLSAAIALAPNDARSYPRRALVRLFLGRPDDAMADAQKGVELYDAQGGKVDDPALGDYRNTRLYVALYSGHYDVAEQDAGTLLASTTPDQAPRLLTSRGFARLQLGDLQQGMDDIQAALKAQPSFAFAYDRRGYAYYLLGDYTAASADFDEALRRIADLPAQARGELHYHRALLLQAQGNMQEAAAEVREADKQVQVPGVKQQIEQLQQVIGAQPGAPLAGGN